MNDPEFMPQRASCSWCPLTETSDLFKGIKMTLFKVPSAYAYVPPSVIGHWQGRAKTEFE